MNYNHEISNFISTAPLYKKINVSEIITSPYDFQDLGVKVFCNKEQDFTTHILSIHPKAALNYYSGLPGAVSASTFSRQKTESFSFTQQFRANCQSCKEHYFDVVLDVKSLEIDDENSKTEITKIGQFPAFTIRPDKTVVKYLDDDLTDFFKKALLNLSHGYGIGAFSYLRRITESLLLKFLNDVASLDYNESKEIKHLLAKHEQNHDMASLVDAVFQHLPESLKVLGNNPFKYLYGELSVGLHKLNESDCVERAEKLSKVLTLMIKKIVEEQTEIAEIRKLMK